MKELSFDQKSFFEEILVSKILFSELFTFVIQSSAIYVATDHQYGQAVHFTD